MDEREIKLRVYHIPNVPREPYYVEVSTVYDAKQILNALANYDLYLGEDVIGTNVQGLMIWEDGEWCDWYDSRGRDIHEVMDAQEAERAA